MSLTDTQVGRIPIIAIRDALLVAVQDALTDNAVRRLKEDVGIEICRANPRTLIVDVSGVDIMDSYLSRAVYDIAIEARLMGVDTMVCGLAPAVAMTLVEMGMELPGVTTAMDLDSALSALQARTSHDRVTDDELVDYLLGGGTEPAASGPSTAAGDLMALASDAPEPDASAAAPRTDG